MNNYDIKLIKEGENKYTILYDNIKLSEELIIEANNMLQKQKSLDYDAIMVDKCKKACIRIKHQYPNVKLKIHKYEDGLYGNGDKTFCIYHNLEETDGFKELCGKIYMDLFWNDEYFGVCICEAYPNINSVEGDWY